MVRILTPEAKAKMEATQREKTQQRARTLTIGDFMVYRSDENNICLSKMGKTPGGTYALYYPDIESALEGAFRRMMDPKLKTDLKGHLAQIRAAEAAIIAAVKAGPRIE